MHMIAIVDYKAGNLTSVRLALEAIQVEAQVTNDPDVVLQVEKVIFPGVGAAGAAMDEVKRLGLDLALKEFFETVFWIPRDLFVKYCRAFGFSRVFPSEIHVRPKPVAEFFQVPV